VSQDLLVGRMDSHCIPAASISFDDDALNITRTMIPSGHEDSASRDGHTDGQHLRELVVMLIMYLSTN
jgi:hypothetical protein